MIISTHHLQADVHVESQDLVTGFALDYLSVSTPWIVYSAYVDVNHIYFGHVLVQQSVIYNIIHNL